MSVLACEGLEKAFGALRATQDVSLEVCGGEIHALIGPNGAGKSTLIQQLCGSLVPDAGRVFLMGEDVTGLGTAARARAGLGRTFQISALALEHTVLENVVLGALERPFGFWRAALTRGEPRARAEAALARVGLSAEAGKLAGALSHGQRRLLEVAVALVRAPKVFLMDEPMAGLGAEGSAQLTELLRALKREAPILLVEHDMDAVFALADRISVLDYGRIIASGSVEEIRAHPEVRRAYLGEEL